VWPSQFSLLRYFVEAQYNVSRNNEDEEASLIRIRLSSSTSWLQGGAHVELPRQITNTSTVAPHQTSEEEKVVMATSNAHDYFAETIMLSTMSNATIPLLRQSPV